MTRWLSQRIFGSQDCTRPSQDEIAAARKKRVPACSIGGCELVDMLDTLATESQQHQSGSGGKLKTKNDKFVYSTPALCPEIHFRSKSFPSGADFHIIIGDVGVPMLKVRARERPIVPSGALRLRSMSDVAISRKSTSKRGASRSHTGCAGSLHLV